MPINLSGTGIAIITPFKDNGHVDFPALDGLLNYWADGKVEYLVIQGTTGESVTLDKEEKVDVLNFITDKVGKNLPLILGIGGNNTNAVCKAIDSFDLSNIQAILSVSPYYNKPSQDGIVQHYQTIAKASPKPIIVYNVPSRTGQNITAKTTIKLAKEVDNIIAVKEASGNFEQIMTIIKNKPSNFSVISGDDALTLPMIAIGADGVISVVANAYPFEFSEMVRNALMGNFEKARKLHYKLLPTIHNLFVEGSPSGIKALMKLKGLCDDTVRLPLSPVSGALKKQIEKEAF